MFHRFVGTSTEREEREGEIHRANSNLGQNQIIEKARSTLPSGYIHPNFIEALLDSQSL